MILPETFSCQGVQGPRAFIDTMRGKCYHPTCLAVSGRGKRILQHLIRSVRNHRGDLVVGLLKALTQIGLFLIFYLLMSIHNWQLTNASRTSATTALFWIAMTAAMHGVYGGYEIGRKKSKPIITNMTLGVLITDLVTFLQLQIMNVNANNNERLLFFTSPDFPYLLLAMILQAVFLFFIVHLGNHLYFSIYPPKRCLLVLGEMSDKAMITDKLNHFRLQWKVEDAVTWECKDLRARVEAAEVVFIASVPENAAMEILQICYDLHRDVLCKAQLQDIMLSSAQQVVIDDAPFLEMDYHKMTLFQRIVKRIGDVVVSAFVLLILSPLLGVIALLIHNEDGGPAIFRQPRMTIGGRNFTIYKFRTMYVHGGEHQVSATKDDPRITKVGRVLRRTRLDELPQFYNILKGDMTLVGPRPEVLDNVEKYKSGMPTFVYREKVKAGLTGYAQIEGKYNTSPEDKLMLDLMYIENFSLLNDVRLIFRTLTVIFRKDSTEAFSQPDMVAEAQGKKGKGRKGK